MARNRIGVNVQTLEFDLDRLTDRVRYIDNERNLDIVQLPVPELGDLQQAVGGGSAGPDAADQ